MWEGTTLTSPNGGSIMLNEKAKKELEAYAKKSHADAKKVESGERYPAPLDGGTDPAPAGAVTMQPAQIWYGDPAEHPHAYITITEETPGTVIVRDGNDESGRALSFSREQWAALTDPDGDGLGEPEGDKKHPAEVRNPDELYKTPDRGKDD